MENSSESYPRERRDTFLVAMYGEVWNNINRHLTVTWESVGVLAGAFAIFALVEKHTLPEDLASALVLLVSAWLVAHTYDANNWFNRNLAIVANIERQFLRPEDARDIHYYFIKHRSARDMVDHLVIQRNFGLGVGVLVLGDHFFTRIVPGFGAPWRNFQPQRMLPYLIATASLIWVWKFRAKRIAKQSEFLKKSPGKALGTTE